MGSPGNGWREEEEVVEENDNEEKEVEEVEEEVEEVVEVVVEEVVKEKVEEVVEEKEKEEGVVEVVVAVEEMEEKVEGGGGDGGGGGGAFLFVCVVAGRGGGLCVCGSSPGYGLSPVASSLSTTPYEYMSTCVDSDETRIRRRPARVHVHPCPRAAEPAGLAEGLACTTRIRLGQDSDKTKTRPQRLKQSPPRTPVP